MTPPNLDQLKPNERQAVQAFVNALRREVNGQVLLLALFGSRARGDAAPDSDIDFLLVTDGQPKEIMDRVIRLESRLGVKHDVELNTLCFDRERWADFARRRAAFWQNAQRDGRLLLRSPRLPDALVTSSPEEESRMPDHRP
ncbi:MAG: nucleotidyltransferase domain-containing protein, partial [Chloroflexi bacterium]|nr:nucleotidyltransferase domain-containing protein [Chloroflexota bacterium]